MSRILVAALAAVAFATLLMVGSPTRSVSADHADDRELILEKECLPADLFEGEEIEVFLEVQGDIEDIDEALDDIGGDYEDADELFDAILDDLDDGQIELVCNEEEGVTLTLSSEVTAAIDDLAEEDVEVSIIIDEVMDGEEFDDLEVTFGDECAGGEISLLDIAEDGVHCLITNAQPTFADLDIEIGKVCAEGAEGSFELNMATSVDLSDADGFLVDLLVDAGVLDDTDPLAFDVDGLLGTIECGETASFVLPEAVRLLIAANLAFPGAFDFEVTLEEVGVDAENVTFSGDCSEDGLLLDVAIEAMVEDEVTLSAIEIEDEDDLLDFLATLSTQEPEFVCEIENDVAADASATLTVHKLCEPEDIEGSFDLLIDDSVEATMECGDTTDPIALSEGTHTISEVAGDDTDLEDFRTFIVCNDGTSLTGTSAEISVGGETICTIINYDLEQVTPPSLDQIVITINNEINNVNDNANVSENTNVSENVNENTQNQANNQDTAVSTGDVNVAGAGGEGTGTGSGTATISPPNTGSAGLADAGSPGFGGGLVIVALASLIGTLPLAAATVARAGR